MKILVNRKPDTPPRVVVKHIRDTGSCSGVACRPVGGLGTVCPFNDVDGYECRLPRETRGGPAGITVSEAAEAWLLTEGN